MVKNFESYLYLKKNIYNILELLLNSRVTTIFITTFGFCTVEGVMETKPPLLKVFLHLALSKEASRPNESLRHIKFLLTH